jgi:hypothetical protein
MVEESNSLDFKEKIYQDLEVYLISKQNKTIVLTLKDDDLKKLFCKPLENNFTSGGSLGYDLSHIKSI